MRIALGVTGCIAAYKSVELLRGLQQHDATVQVVMTAHATQFVGPLTFQAISGLPVITEMFGVTDDPEIKHIQLAQTIDLLLVAPATANALAKFAAGIADDFLSTLYVSTTAPVLVAPAMNAEMWRHPATRENVLRLRERGVEFVDPSEGYLACKTVGPGRLAETETIVGRALSIIVRQEQPGRESIEPSVPEETAGPSQTASGRPKRSLDMEGQHVLVTAGPTYEAIDPVRGITNRSSGRMGYAIAEAALDRGAEVTLVTGPVSLSPPQRARTLRVQSAGEMRRAVLDNLQVATVIVMAAAVADYTPIGFSSRKLKKDVENLVIELTPTTDILAEIAALKQSRIVVGFAAETDDVVANARKKLIEKGADLIVANNVLAPDSGFDVETNRVTILTRRGKDELPLLSKREVADRILDAVIATLMKPIQSSAG